MKKLSVGVLGATGTIGQMFLSMLDGHPYFDVECIAASKKSAGKKLRDMRVLYPICDDFTGIRIQDIELADYGSLDLVFSGLPSDMAGDVETRIAKEGAWVFSNAASHRMDRHAPILLPEVNAPHIKVVERQTTPGKIVTNSNCTTVGLVLALAPIKDLCARVHMVSYQALSGAGYPGLPSLDGFGNVIPYIQSEEEKVVEETRKMLGLEKGGAIEDWNVEVTAQCARVPVRDGHLEAVSIDLKRKVDVREIRKMLSSFRGEIKGMSLPTAPEQPIIVMDELDRPQPALDVYAGSPARARGMSACVGRLNVQGTKLMFYVLSHNVIRGGSGESILNAEYALAKGYLKR
jgi:aspartate-semialdehyde dehydrogenase